MKLIIETLEGTQVVEYTKLALEEIEKRIRTYEQQYGSYDKFMGQYDCDSSSVEDSVIVIEPF